MPMTLTDNSPLYNDYSKPLLISAVKLPPWFLMVVAIMLCKHIENTIVRICNYLHLYIYIYIYIYIYLKRRYDQHCTGITMGIGVLPYI